MRKVSFKSACFVSKKSKCQFGQSFGQFLRFRFRASKTVSFRRLIETSNCCNVPPFQVPIPIVKTSTREYDGKEKREDQLEGPGFLYRGNRLSKTQNRSKWSLLRVKKRFRSYKSKIRKKHCRDLVQFLYVKIGLTDSRSAGSILIMVTQTGDLILNKSYPGRIENN